MRAFCLSSCPGMGRCVLLTEKRPGQPRKRAAPTVFVVVTPLAASIGYGRLPNGRTFHQGQVVSAPDCGGFPEA